MDIEKIIEKMTLEDKVQYCTGANFWKTKQMEQYGIESVYVSDGPHGLRYQSEKSDNLGLNDSAPSTCFPTAVTSADSWNEEMIHEVGEAIAEEALEYGVSVVLGPGCNIKRNPLGGRNFEYFSEDPYLAGKMAASFIRGVQSKGIGTSLKHFACNNQEYKRQNGDSQLDERTFREIYLKPFEIAVKEAKPQTVMCSYNKINGVYSSDNSYLLNDILRNEWGFDGLVMTDWGAMADRIKAFKAGCDLNMPGNNDYMVNAVMEAVRNGQLDEKDIDLCVSRILELVEKGLKHKKEYTFDRNRHHKVARKMAIEGAVLLKNEGDILPLNKKDICILGDMAQDLRYQGSGSSHINPTRLKQIKEIYDIPYAVCVSKEGELIDLEAGLKLAKENKIVVIFAGLPESYESEGFDRKHMRLPEGHNKLIHEISKINPNVVVVLLGGSAMELPWADKVKGILYMGLPGQAGAEAIFDLLEGTENPSGKLSESWPYSYEDVICKDTFGQKNTEYREGIYVGYRYYDKAGIKVRYPFGYGLSYTTFVYSDLKCKDGRLSLTVKNTGKRKGKEVVQLYVSPQDDFCRAKKELKAFTKVELASGESKEITFEIRDDMFEVYDDGFRKIAGAYDLMIGRSSEEIILHEKITVKGEQADFTQFKDSWYETLKGKPTRNEWEKLMGHEVAIVPEPKKGQYTMDNSCLEMKDHSLMMKIQYMVTKSVIDKAFAKEERTMDNASYKMMMTAATDCPMRAVVISSDGMMKEGLARGMLDMANGHIIKGIIRMIKG